MELLSFEPGARFLLWLFGGLAGGALLGAWWERRDGDHGGRKGIATP